jgi:hypothetical protein
VAGGVSFLAFLLLLFTSMSSWFVPIDYQRQWSPARRSGICTMRSPFQIPINIDRVAGCQMISARQPHWEMNIIFLSRRARAHVLEFSEYICIPPFLTWRLVLQALMDG